MFERTRMTPLSRYSAALLSGFLALTLADSVSADVGPLTAAQIIEIPKGIPGNGYQWGGSTWSTDAARRGVCVEVAEGTGNGCSTKTCQFDNGDANGGTLVGTDCSGLLSKAWELVGPLEPEKPTSKHYGSFEYLAAKPGYWTVVELKDVQPGDILARPKGPTTSGHVMLFAGWQGTSQIPLTIEAQDCKWGMRYKGARRSFTPDSWVAARRENLGEPRACEANTCNSHGTCAGGICTCSAGFAGNDCEKCASGFFGATCQPPGAQCKSTATIGCGFTGTVTPSTGTNTLSSYSCSLADGNGPELVYAFDGQGKGKATVTADNGTLALLRTTCAAEACEVSGKQTLQFDYDTKNSRFLVVESAGATGSVNLSVTCESTVPRWIGDACASDTECQMEKADGTKLSGKCYKAADAVRGFCTLDCASTNGCPDLAEKAPSACVADPAGTTTAMCVPTAHALNNSCSLVPGSKRQDLPKVNRPASTANVCAPPASGASACVGRLQGQVRDVLTLLPVVDAAISILGAKSTFDASSDIDGKFELEVPCDLYDLLIDADGYAPDSARELVESGARVPVDIKLSPVAECADSIVLTGKVIDAMASPASSIADAVVEVRAGTDATSGDVIDVTTTDAAGAFTFFDLIPGSYTVTVTADGYSPTWDTLHACEAASAGADIALTPAAQIAKMRIALTWGQPPDLDLHIQLPSPAGREVYYSDACRGSSTESPFVSLDVDRKTAAGAEIMSVAKFMPGKYTVFVHNFSQQVKTQYPDDFDVAEQDVNLSDSGATLTVYGEDGSQIQRFLVPSGTGYFWEAFSFDGSANGAITPIQTLSNGRANPDTGYDVPNCRPAQ